MQNKISWEKLTEMLVERGHLPRDVDIRVLLVQRDEMRKRFLARGDSKEIQDIIHLDLLEIAGIRISGMAVRHNIYVAFQKYIEKLQCPDEYRNLCMEAGGYIDAMTDDQGAIIIMKEENAKQNAEIDAVYTVYKKARIAIRITVGVIVATIIYVLWW
jgi:hypothetical protein